MKIRYINCITQKMEEREVIAEGTVAFYVKQGEGLKAIPKEDVGAKIMYQVDMKVSPISIFEYIKTHGKDIKFVDFSLWGSDAA